MIDFEKLKSILEKHPYYQIFEDDDLSYIEMPWGELKEAIRKTEE